MSPTRKIRPEQLRAAIYCRISEDEAEGAGVLDQEHDGAALCWSKGWTFEVFTDNDQTASEKGRKKERKRFEAMMVEVRAGRIDVIVCRDWARLTRDYLVGAELLELGKSFRSFTVWYFGTNGEQSWRLGIDWTTGLGVSDAEDENARAARYAREISEKVKRAKLRHAKAGRPSGGRVPFGYTSVDDDGKYRARQIDPYESELIRTAVEDILNGKTAYRVACEWQDAGVPTKYARGWDVPNVISVLTTPTIAGLVVYRKDVLIGDDGQPVRGQWDPIITEDKRQAVRARLAANAQDKGNAQALKRSYLLRGLLVCGECGRKLAGVGGGKPNYGASYGCKPGKLLPGCGMSVKQTWIDDIVTLWVWNVLNHPAMLDAVHAESAMDIAERDRLDAENIADRQMVTDLAKNTTHETLAFDRVAAAAAEKRIAERVSRMKDISSNSVLDRYAGAGDPAIWKTYDQDTQREIISALIEKVTVKRGRRGEKLDPKATISLAFLPERVSIEWRYAALEPIHESLQKVS